MQDSGHTGKPINAVGGDANGGKLGQGNADLATVFNKVVNIGNQLTTFDANKFNEGSNFFQHISNRIAAATPSYFDANAKKTADLQNKIDNPTNLTQRLNKFNYEAEKARLNTVSDKGKADLLASSYAGGLRDQATKQLQSVTGNSNTKDWLGL